MKLFTQSFLYDDPWSIVSLAFFLRYPNPYASHVISCDVISRAQTDSGSLLTTRLILKRGALPRWARGFVSRAESWVIEESEVDPTGKTVRCRTRNLDHVKVMQVEESVIFRQTQEGKTLQTTEARIKSGFGWGLAKSIENHGLNRFKANVQRSREGVSLILSLLRQSRLQPMALESSSFESPDRFMPSETFIPARRDASSCEREEVNKTAPDGSWTRLMSWFRP